MVLVLCFHKVCQGPAQSFQFGGVRLVDEENPLPVAVLE